jgi:hypothetical protein
MASKIEELKKVTKKLNEVQRVIDKIEGNSRQKLKSVELTIVLNYGE